MKPGPSMALSGKDRVHRRSGGVQVVIEQAGLRRPPLLLAVLLGGEAAGVGAQQVMQAVPARPGGLSEMRSGQLLQQPAGPFGRFAGERGNGVAIEVGAGMQAKQTERTACTCVQ